MLMLIMPLVEKSVVFQQIVQIIMDYHIKYILLHQVINIKTTFVIIFYRFCFIKI